MKILQTAILLITTLLAVPLFSYYFGTALGSLEWKALMTLIQISAFVAFYCFVTGELTRNYSQVDKIWSLVPIAYVWILAAYGNYTPRLVIMSVLVSIWAIRLTANFALKGAYRLKFWEGEEDYRWKVLRQKPEFKPRWKWTLFNLFFISIYQNALILLFCLPALVALQFNSVPINTWDYTIAGLMFLFIVYEAVADIQQWNFQSKKWQQINAGQTLSGDYKKGFLDKGLWAYSRHPNYFGEQAIWICFYFFSVPASGQWFNWSIAGCLLLLLLFQGSAGFSEEISAQKYPGYVEYQKNVSRFIPCLRLK